MTTRKSSPTRSRKKTDIKVGDVLLLPQSNGKHTLAYVLGLWPNLESIMTVALLSKEAPADKLLGDDLASIISDEIGRRHLIAIISTPAGTAKCGDWPRIGTVTGINVDDLLPSKPFKTNSLVGATYVSAPFVEGLVEAYRGLAEWEALLPGRPGYLKSLLFQSDLGPAKQAGASVKVPARVQVGDIQATKPSDETIDETIAVYIKLSNDKYGTEEERDSIYQFTDKLVEVVLKSGAGVFDGDEFGNGECGLFMYGPNADRLFSAVESLLRSWKPLEGGYVIKRYGAPDGQSERIEF